MPKYIYPPRPRSILLPAQLAEEEQRGGWLWQHKFNGDRCIAVVESTPSSRKVTLGNRRGRFHPNNKFPNIRAELSSQNFLLPTGTHYLDGELLVENGMEVLVLFDVLQWTNYLIGKTQEHRLHMLREILGNPTEPCSEKIALSVTKHIWMARTGDKDFVSHYEEYIDNDLIEGLVLKKRDAVLDNWGSSEYEVDWQIRCRKPSKKYRF